MVVDHESRRPVLERVKKGFGMLPLERVNIVRIKDLQPGDFAIVLDEHRGAVLVGTYDAKTFLTVLDEPNMPIAPVAELDEGYALAIREWQIEVDERSVDRFEHLNQRIGSLSIVGGKLALACGGGMGGQHAKLSLTAIEGVNAPSGYAFPYWRLITIVRDKAVQLYERGAPAAQ